MTASNYLWLMTIVRLSQHCLGMLQTFAANNLIYVNMPEADQTNYISFHTVLANLAVLASLGTSTWLVATMGNSKWQLFGHSMGLVPTLFLVQFVLFMLLGVFVLLIRKKVEPEGIKI